MMTDKMIADVMFTYVQPEDFSKLGMEPTTTSEMDHFDMMVEAYESNMDTFENHDPKGRHRRAERRRRNRNKKTSRRIQIANLCGYSACVGRTANPEEIVREQVVKNPEAAENLAHLIKVTSSCVGEFAHSERVAGRECSNNLKAVIARKEMRAIRQEYLGNVPSELLMVEMEQEEISEQAVQEEISELDCFKAGFTEEELETVAKAAEILGLNKDWLFFKSFEAYEAKQTFLKNVTQVSA